MRQLFKLTLCVMISAPLILESYALINEFLGERFSAWWAMAGCLLFWSFGVGIGIQWAERRALRQTLLDGVGLSLLAASVNFLLVVAAMFTWLAFFFAS